MKKNQIVKLFFAITLITYLGFALNVNADHEGEGGGDTVGSCNCYYGCDKVVPSERSISVVSYDVKGQPLTFNDTTSYGCTLRYTQCCAVKDNLCKKVIEKTSVFEKSLLKKEEAWNTYVVSAKTTFKCDDNREQSTGSFQKTLRIRDCSVQNKTLQDALVRVEEKCVKAVVEIEEKCSAKKKLMQESLESLEAKERELNSASAEFSTLQEEFEKLSGELDSLELQRSSYVESVAKSREELNRATRELEDAKRSTVACWEEGTLHAIGLEGTISGVMTFIGVNWRNLIAQALNDQENLKACKAKTCVEFAQDKLKAAQKSYEKALEKFNADTESLNSFDNSLDGERLKQLKANIIPTLESEIKEKQGLIQKLGEEKEELQVAYESALKEHEECAGVECKSAKENEALAKLELEKCMSAS